jgi:hypothetical protein
MSSYQTLIGLLLALGAFSVAHQLNRLVKRKTGFFRVHLGVLIFGAAWGLAFLSGGLLRPPSAGAAAAALPVGLAVGYAALRLDRAILRRLRSRSRERSRAAALPDAPRLPGAARSPRAGSVEAAPELLPWLAIAVLEELLYRGILTDLALSLPGWPLTAAALLGVALVFALSHINFGLEHVAAKAPLGVLAALSVLLLGTVWPAVVGHVLFNGGIWRSWRHRPQLVAAGRPSLRLRV